MEGAFRQGNMTVLPPPFLMAAGGPSIWKPGALRESEAGQRAQRVSSHHSHTVQHESPHTQPGESYRPDTLRTRGGWAQDATRGLGRSKGVHLLASHAMNVVSTVHVVLFCQQDHCSFLSEVHSSPWNMGSLSTHRQGIFMTPFPHCATLMVRGRMVLPCPVPCTSKMKVGTAATSSLDVASKDLS